MRKTFYLLCSVISLLLWFIGAVLPLIPGWVFLITAFYCLYRFSPQYADKLTSSPKVKKLIPQRVLEKLEKDLRREGL